MRVKVTDVEGGVWATMQAGERLRELIAPALARGEEVELDFEGVRHYSAAFFADVFHELIRADVEDRLPQLVRFENLPQHGQDAFDAMRLWAVRWRENPKAAAAAAEVAMKFFERD
jgi:hypothetical protein